MPLPAATEWNRYQGYLARQWLEPSHRFGHGFPGATPALVLELVHRLACGALQPNRAAYSGEALRPLGAEATLESPEGRLSAPVAHRVRDWPPAEAAQIADECVAFPLRDRLAAEQAGGRQEPALHARQRSRDLSEGQH